MLLSTYSLPAGIFSQIRHYSRAYTDVSRETITRTLSSLSLLISYYYVIDLDAFTARCIAAFGRRAASYKQHGHFVSAVIFARLFNKQRATCLGRRKRLRYEMPALPLAVPNILTAAFGRRVSHHVYIALTASP